MSIEAIAGSAAPIQIQTVNAGYGANLGDVTGFQNALAVSKPAQPAGAVDSADAITPAMRGMFNALEKVNGEAKQVAEYAAKASASGNDMSPGEIVQLTMRCHEFMFHCQLSSSVANRTSDGLQQLFRQQS